MTIKYTNSRHALHYRDGSFYWTDGERWSVSYSNRFEAMRAERDGIEWEVE